nr:hypothetical protein [Ardenticatena sp.]
MKQIRTVVVKVGVMVSAIWLFTTLLAYPVWAHSGAPIVVVRDLQLGAYLIERLLADPDVGGGTFEVTMTVDGAPPPEGTVVRFDGEPLDGASPALSVEAQRSPNDARTFIVTLPFDREGEWRLSLAITGPAGDERYEWTMRVTPPGGFSPVSLLCLLPFAAAGVLWWWGARHMEAPTLDT